MSKQISVFAIFAIMIVGSVLAMARDVEYAGAIEEGVIYHKCGYRWYYPEFRGNEKRFGDLIGRIDSLSGDTSVEIRRIEVVGSASPEGLLKAQVNLARNRAVVAAGELCSHAGLPDSLVVVGVWGVDWSGLRDMIAGSDKAYRAEVLEILTEDASRLAATDMSVAARIKSELVGLRGGAVWNDMLKSFFPDIRYARFVVRYDRPVILPEESAAAPSDTVPAVADTVMSVGNEIAEMHAEADTVQEETAVAASPGSEMRPLFMDVRTNMLYDALLVPNAGIEFYLGRGWSIGADWMYAWWKTDRRHYYWRTYGGDLFVRKWFGHGSVAKPLSGHHVGLYGQILTYDLELGGRGYLGDRWSYAAGVEYGYSLPVARRVNIDFSLGLGYLGGQYKEYIPIDGHYVWQSTRRRHWFGPTKLEVSLVWLIGCGNVNEKRQKVTMFASD